MAGSEESAENLRQNSALEHEQEDTAETLMAKFIHPIRKEFRVPKKRVAVERDAHVDQAAGPTNGGEKREGEGDADARDIEDEPSSVGNKRVRIFMVE